MKNYNLNLTQEELVMVHLVLKNQIDTVKPKLRSMHNLERKKYTEDMLETCEIIVKKTREVFNENN